MRVESLFAQISYCPTAVVTFTHFEPAHSAMQMMCSHPCPNVIDCFPRRVPCPTTDPNSPLRLSWRANLVPKIATTAPWKPPTEVKNANQSWNIPLAMLPTEGSSRLTSSRDSGEVLVQAGIFANATRVPPAWEALRGIAAKDTRGHVSARCTNLYGHVFRAVWRLSSMALDGVDMYCIALTVKFP